MTTPSKPESPQVFLVLHDMSYDDQFEGDKVMGVFFDRGRALNRFEELVDGDPLYLTGYRVEAWREGDTEGEEIKPD